MTINEAVAKLQEVHKGLSEFTTTETNEDDVLNAVSSVEDAISFLEAIEQE
jgi:hypothetical protein